MSTTAMILAAGMGLRLKEHTAQRPKSLVEIAGRPLVGYAIAHARALGADRIVVVGGFCFEDLKACVREIDPEITVVENPQYQMQNLLSFKEGLSAVPEGDNLFVINADYIMLPHTLEAMKKEASGFSVFSSYDFPPDTEDTMKVKVNDAREMTAMTKTLEEFEAIYTGFWFVEASRMNAVRAEVDELLATTDHKAATVEHIFAKEVASGRAIRVPDIGTMDWYEVDTPEELQIARDALSA